MILMIFKMAKIILKWLKNYYDDIFRISRLLQVFCRPVYFPTLNQISLTYLWNDGESWPQILQSDRSDIKTINKNPSTSSLQNTKQG